MQLYDYEYLHVYCVYKVLVDNFCYPVQTIIALIEGGANPHTRNQHGDTPLHSIIKTISLAKSGSWSEEKTKKVAAKKQSCLVALLTYGNCDPNCRAGNGMTPLHLAVEVNTTNHYYKILQDMMLKCNNDLYQFNCVKPVVTACIGQQKLHM